MLRPGLPLRSLLCNAAYSRLGRKPIDPHELKHHAVSRIVPHGRALRRDWRLQEIAGIGVRSHCCEQLLSGLGNGNRLLRELGAFGREKT
jgi:hypothetical protein